MRRPTGWRNALLGRHVYIVRSRYHTLQGHGNMTQQSGAGQLIDTYTWYNGLRLLADGSVRSHQAPELRNPCGRAHTRPSERAEKFGCGLDLGGHITCWTNGSSMRLPYADVEFKYLGAGGTSVCGVTTDDSTLRCWTFRGPPYTLLANVPDGAFRMVDMSYHGVAFCGLRMDGAVQCWAGQPLTQDNRQTRDESPYYGYWVYDRPAELDLIAMLDDAPDEDTLGYTMVTMDRRYRSLADCAPTTASPVGAMTTSTWRACCRRSSRPGTTAHCWST